MQANVPYHSKSPFVNIPSVRFSCSSGSGALAVNLLRKGIKELRLWTSMIILISVMSGYSYPTFGQTTYVSAVSGSWDDGTTWVGGVVPGVNDNAVITSGTTVSLQGSNATIRDLNIEAGAVLNGENRIMTVNGTLVVDGTYTSKNAAAKDFEFNGSIIEGGGSIIIDFVNRDFKINANTSISNTSEIIFYGNVVIASGANVTNNGTVEVTGNLTGDNSTTSVWINSNNSVLKIGNNLLATGRLNASAPGNTIEYYSATDQTLKIPAASLYNNLTLRGSGNKNVPANIIVGGNLLISGSAVLAGNNFNIEVKGNWNNYSDFLEGTGVVSFTGTGNQDLVNPAGEYFSNLTVNKPGGEVILKTNTVVGNTFTLSNGVVNASSFRLILGTGLASTGTLAYTGGYIKGKFEKWINSTGTHLFPVGADRVQEMLITLSGFDSGGTLIAEFIPSDPGNNGLSLDDAGTMIHNTFVEGYWVLNRDNGFTMGGIYNYDLQLNGNGFTSFLIDADTRILTRSDAFDIWVAEGSHLSAVGQSARRTGVITNPAHYALGDLTVCVRPVTSAITGSSDVCTGQTSVLYSVVDNPPNTYTWTITGGVQVSGGNTASITVDWGTAGLDNASVKVVESNSCTSGAPVTLPVFIHSVPPASITGKQIVAENTTGVPYSVAALPAYTYTWIITGGTQASGGNTNSITVDWGSVGMGSVEVVAELPGCNPAPPVKIDVRKYDVIESIATGDWDSPATWDCNCVPLSTQSVRIRNGHTVNLHNSNSFEINNMIIDLGGTLDYNSRPFKVHGDFIVNGTYAGGSNRVLTLDGMDKEIDGVGTVIGGFTISSGNKVITPTAVFDIIAGNITLGNSVYVTNNGRIYLNGNLSGSSASSVWDNAMNSDLEVSGSLLSNGTLRAGAPGNTVEYTGTAAQTVKTPFSSLYHNLIVSGASVKSLSGSILINGDLTINASNTLDATSGNHNINIRGNWINAGGIFSPAAATVFFDGAVDQSVAGTETYNNLTMSNSTGDLILNNDIVVGGILNLAGKDIITGTNILHVGTDAANTGSVTRTSGVLIGRIERWAGSFGDLLFPVGQSGSYNPVNIYINALATSGSILCEFIPTDPGSAGLPLVDDSTPISYHMSEGYWNMQAKNGFAAANYNVSLGTQNFTSYPVNINTRVLKRTDGGNWIFDGTHSTASPPTIYRNNLTGGISAVSTQFGVGFACAPATITSVVTNVTCFGDSDGAIDITVTDAALPLSYAWTPGGQTTQDISGLTADTYTVTVTDANACVTSEGFTVLQPSALVVSEAVTNVSCGGTDDGAINITVTGGTTPYLYSWSTVDGSGLVATDEDQTGLTAGTYTVLVLDVNGCQVIKNIVVLQSEIPVPTLSGPTPVCQGITGNIYTTEAGMTNYIWTVSPGGLITSGGTFTDNTITITWDTPGSHLVTVNYTNSFGCTGILPATFSVNVDPLPGPAGTISGTSSVCVGESGIAYNIAPVSDAAGYIWNYTGTGATITGAANNITIDFSSSATSGVLTVYAFNPCGNGTVSPDFPITVSPLNTIILTSPPGTTNQSVCINTPVNLITYEVTGATGATFSDLPPGVSGVLAGNIVTISGSPAIAGTFNYSVTLTGGCGNISAGGTIVSIPDNTITLTSAVGTDAQTVCVNTPVTDIVYSYTGATGASFSGLPDGMTVSNVGNVITLKGSPAVHGVYSYLIQLTGGCGNVSATGTITVTPDNTITLTSAPGTDNQTICIGAPVLNITYATTGATGATVSGLP
ncbi:MAG: SprB repeat-containing protein, partial [Bacteroidales bacterium]|nr:SprB repeat-containing protein [Bacteroidales bacterium]